MNINPIKYILALCIIFIGYISYIQLYSVQAISINVDTNSPDTIVFAFDIHGVMFKNDMWAMFTEVIKNIDSSILLNLLKNPSFLYTALILRCRSGVVEEILTTLAQKYPFFEPYLPIYIRISNLQKPILDTIKIMQLLKTLGYKIFIFSNIGSKTFDQFTNIYPTIFNGIDGAVVSQLKDNWIQKPQKDAYEKLLHAFNLQPKNIIFIDDKQANIKAAQELGFNTIYFSSPQDLIEGLEELKISIPNRLTKDA